MSKYGLTPEKYEQLLHDCSNKVQKISDSEWSEIVNKYDLCVHYDTLRKSSQFITGGAFVSEYYKWKHEQGDCSDEYLKELELKKGEIIKEKRKLYDQRREHNKLITSDARAEHLMEEIIKAANKLNEEKPLDFGSGVSGGNSHKEAVLCWADWHYGMVTDNIWNTYNTDICRKRVQYLVEKSKEYIRLNNVETLNVLMLGDSAHGSIHATCRVKSEEDACDQIMHVTELMAESIAELSKVVENVKVFTCYGNHMRSIQNKSDSVHSDNMEKIVPWWLRVRFQNSSKIEIIESEYKEFTKLKVLNSNICAVHGDLEKNFKQIGVTLNTLFSKKFGESIDYTISADKHHIEEFETLGINSVLVPCLCGTDDYANDNRLYSGAAQTLMIFNDEYGRESTYHIPLNIY